MLATAWHFPRAIQPLRFQWPPNGSCFPPLVWQAWLWPVTQRKSSLIRLSFLKNNEIPSSIYQIQFHTVVMLTWKTLVVVDLKLLQTHCKCLHCRRAAHCLIILDLISWVSLLNVTWTYQSDLQSDNKRHYFRAGAFKLYNFLSARKVSRFSTVFIVSCIETTDRCNL